MTRDTRNRNIIIAIIVVLLLACCCVAASLTTGLIVGAGRQAAQNLDRFELGTVPATTTFSRSFAVDEPAELSVKLDVGSLVILPGESDSIQVDATVRAFGVSASDAQALLDRLQLTAVSTGSRVEVVGTWSGGDRFNKRSPQVDVRIAVPTQTDIQVDLGAGSVQISGVTGNADVRADVGQVTLRDLDIRDTLTVSSNVAEVSYSGSLNEGSEYRLVSDVGAIRLALPADSSFAIDAASDLGTVIVDFDVVGESSRALTGATVKGVVGGGGNASLYLRSDVGAIYVRQQ